MGMQGNVVDTEPLCEEGSCFQALPDFCSGTASPCAAEGGGGVCPAAESLCAGAVSCSVICCPPRVAMSFWMVARSHCPST
eukprot:952328-Heterocapsa_arctica.AAC.1